VAGEVRWNDCEILLTLLIKLLEGGELLEHWAYYVGCASCLVADSTNKSASKDGTPYSLGGVKVALEKVIQEIGGTTDADNLDGLQAKVG
jgi:hypothetical protein